MVEEVFLWQLDIVICEPCYTVTIFLSQSPVCLNFDLKVYNDHPHSMAVYEIQIIQVKTEIIKALKQFSYITA